ncbi:MAG: hypothetical protein FJ009_01720 [Chloroflexi bacterium]|nr:hypothetical protein [Chloroflexota bacterium]
MNHQRVFGLTILAGLVAVLAACSSAAPTTPAQVSGLDTNYANALNARSLLLLGIVRLEEGSGPVLTKEQATTLIPLWQASKSLMGSGTASQAEIDAITNQIQGVLTSEQIKTVNALHLTQADMQAFNQTIGVSAPSGVPSGGVPGQGQTLSPAERATRQAQMGGTGGNTASIDYLIGILQRKAAK